MTDPAPPSPAERLRQQQQAEHIRAVAAVIKGAVRKHYPDAAFEEMPEYGNVNNVQSVRFEPAHTGHDGDTRPAFAMAAFHIGSEDSVDPAVMEKSRRALARDLQTLFGAASTHPRFEPSAGSMIFQKQCTGTATAYGEPEALHAAMRQAMENNAELRYLLPRAPKVQMNFRWGEH